jgi:hypothetical protein
MIGFCFGNRPRPALANGSGKSVFKSWRNLRARAMGARTPPDQAVSRWWPGGLLCRPFPARRVIEHLPRQPSHRRACASPCLSYPMRLRAVLEHSCHQEQWL